MNVNDMLDEQGLSFADKIASQEVSQDAPIIEHIPVTNDLDLDALKEQLDGLMNPGFDYAHCKEDMSAIPHNVESAMAKEIGAMDLFNR